MIMYTKTAGPSIAGVSRIQSSVDRIYGGFKKKFLKCNIGA